MPRHWRVWLFAALAIVCVVVAVAVLAAARSEETAESPTTTTVQGPALTPGPGTIVYLSLDRQTPANFGRVAVASLDHLDTAPTLAPFTCTRVSFDAGVGVCLTEKRSVPPRTTVTLFGADLASRATFSLPGVPTRTRVAPDGRLAGITTFVTGHSYASLGEFSTATVIIDTQTGARIGQLENFRIERNGKRFKEIDFNFWGVTFAPAGDRFYATLASRGKTYLIEGHARSGTAKVIRENVECPSLSPDGTRIGFKKRVGGSGVWRFSVLNLATMTETPLAETRPIDDQLAWLDDGNVLYHNGEEVWTVPADGTGTPKRFMPAADSPQVVRS
jgi:hypothetical protein